MMQSTFERTAIPSGGALRVAGRMPPKDVLTVVRELAPARVATRGRSLEGKRAAVVVYSYYSCDRRPKREAEALERQGMEVDVICLRKEAERPFQGRIDGVNVFRVPMRRRRESKLRYLAQYTSFFLAAFGIVSMRHLRKPYDLVHVHNMPDFLVFSALLPRLSGAKVILDMHDPMPELFGSIYASSSGEMLVRCLKWVEKLSMAFADQVVTPNLAFAQLFTSRSCDRKKVEIVMNSPEDTVFSPDRCEAASEPPPKKTFDLIYHGLMAERQGVDVAVRAVSALRERIPNIRLHLYGESTAYSEQVMQLVKELKLEGVVCYHGYKALHEVPAVIEAADIGLVPNRLNAFTAINMPTRIFEYLALNRAAIVPRTAGIQDYFKDDELMFFEAGNATDLAIKIEWAYSHPEEVEEIIAKGRKVYRRHGWDIEQKKLVGLVENLTATQRPN